MVVSCRYSRGIRLKRILIVGIGSMSIISFLIGLIDLVMARLSGATADLGWFLLAIVLLSLTFWGRSSSWLLPVLADSGPSAHRARRCVVWLLVGAVVLLIVLLKVSAEDLNSYQSLVFEEGGLVEWGQVAALAAACRVTWLIASDLKNKFVNRFPALLARGLAVFLAVLMLEELAWGQVIFGWQTPESIRAINAQEETTFHNIAWFQDRLDVVTLLATVLVLVVVLLAPRICRRALSQCSSDRRSLVMSLMPATYTWPLFLFVVGVAYCVATGSFSEIIYNRDQEWGELVLYGSVLLLLLRTRVLLGVSEQQSVEV